MCSRNLDNSEKESGEEEEGKAEEVEDGNASKHLFFIYQKVVDDYNDDHDNNDYNDDGLYTQIVDLFRSDLIVHGVNVDVGEEGGQGDQQGHLKRKYLGKTETQKQN